MQACADSCRMGTSCVVATGLTAFVTVTNSMPVILRQPSGCWPRIVA
jgi:hypothetical protein